MDQEIRSVPRQAASRRDLRLLEGVVRAKRPIRLPIVLTVEEVKALLAQLPGTVWIVGSLL